MTSPPEEVTVTCPACDHVYRDWIRASINLDLGEPWTEEEIERATTATCPKCGHVVGAEALVVSENEWTFLR